MNNLTERAKLMAKVLLSCVEDIGRRDRHSPLGIVE